MNRRRLLLLAAGLTLLVVAALGAVAYLLADRYCPAHTGYFAVRVAPDDTYYFRVEGSEMRLARTPAQLLTATPVRALSVGETSIVWASDAQLTPDRGSSEWEKIHVGIYAVEPLPERRAKEKPAIVVDLGLPTEDRQGHRWVYWVRAEVPVQGKPEAMPQIKVPPRDRLTLALQQQELPIHRVGLALDMRLGGLPVTNITRDGQSVPAQVIVSDDTGRDIASATGGLNKFGLSDEHPLYSVEVQRKRHYTVSAAIDGGPLGELHALTTIALPPRTTRNQGYCPSLPCGSDQESRN